MIFIAHSSKDNEIIKKLKKIEEQLQSKFYFAEDFNRIEGRSIAEKLRRNVQQSDLMIVFWTNNVETIQTTRDIINTEIGMGYYRETPILLFKEKGTTVPLFVDNITDYTTYNKNELEELMKELQVYLRGWESEESKQFRPLERFINRPFIFKNRPMPVRNFLREIFR